VSDGADAALATTGLDGDDGRLDDLDGLERHGLRVMLTSATETATRHSEDRTRALEAKTGK